MIPFVSRCNYLYLGIPRESGDDPATTQQFLHVSLYSPRERG